MVDGKPINPLAFFLRGKICRFHKQPSLSLSNLFMTCMFTLQCNTMHSGTQQVGSSTDQNSKVKESGIMATSVALHTTCMPCLIVVEFSRKTYASLIWSSCIRPVNGLLKNVSNTVCVCQHQHASLNFLLPCL